MVSVRLLLGRIWLHDFCDLFMILDDLLTFEITDFFYNLFTIQNNSAFLANKTIVID